MDSQWAQRPEEDEAAEAAAEEAVRALEQESKTGVAKLKSPAGSTTGGACHAGQSVVSTIVAVTSGNVPAGAHVSPKARKSPDFGLPAYTTKNDTGMPSPLQKLANSHSRFHARCQKAPAQHIYLAKPQGFVKKEVFHTCL